MRILVVAGLIGAVLASLRAEDDDIHKHNQQAVTPQRVLSEAAAAASSSDPSPGERANQSQAQELKRELFESVLGQELITQWDINWKVFQQADLPFDDSAKRKSIRKIADLLRKVLRTPGAGDLFIKVSELQSQVEDVHLDRLKQQAELYFRQLLQKAFTCCFMPKTDGDQLGTRLVLTSAEGERITYYIKTHSEGRRKTESSAAKTIDPRELLVYKVLEHIGVGCRSHFFARSSKEVYIATADAATGGIFTRFLVMTGEDDGKGVNVVIGRRLAGALIDIHKDPDQLDRGGIEQSLHSDRVAQNFIYEMVKLDFITRICRLHDLLNNPENFGFFESKEALPSIRVIDFRVMDDPSLRVGEDNWRGFLEGNGVYQYSGSHKTMRYVLHDRSEPLRLKAAKKVMITDGFMDKMQEAVQRAYRDVTLCLSQDVFNTDRATLTSQLREYKEALIANSTFFITRLMESQ